MATAVQLSRDALDRARRGSPDRLAGELADRTGADELVGALAGTRVVARCLLAAPDGLTRLDLHAGDGVALLLDGDGGDPAQAGDGLVSSHLDALVHLVVESVGLQWRPVPASPPFTVDDPTDVPTAVLDYPGSALAAHLPPSVDPARLRWWSLQFPGSSGAVEAEVTVLDAHRAGLFHQDGTRLEPTTSALAWDRLWAGLSRG